MRRRTALIAALTLPLALMTAPAIAEGPTPTPPTPTPATPAPGTGSTGAALAQAKKENKRVEIESLRSETATYFANPDGKTLTTEFHIDPIRVRQGDAWRPVDTTLVNDNGTIKPRATKSELTLSPGGGTDLLTAKRQSDGSTIKIATPYELPAPKLSSNRAEYPNAYGPGIDLAVIATPTGFRQEVIVRQRPASPLKLQVPVQLPAGVSFDETSAGKLALHDTTGEAKRRTTEIPAPLLVDASADLGIGEEGHVGKVTTSVEESTVGQVLVYQPDAKFLADPKIIYPVTFVAADTEWTELPVGNDTFINNSSYQNGYANSGAYHLQAGKTNEGTVRWRTYIRFEDIPEDSPLRGGRVTNADLVLWNIASNDCGTQVGSGITARRVTQRWDVSTLTWSNQPTVTSDGADTEYGAYNPGCGRGYMDYEWDLYHYVNGIVQEWADGEPNYGFQLTAGNESDYTNWRAYRSREYGEDGAGSHGPKLVIGYEPASVTELSAVAWSFDGEPELGHDQDYFQSVIDNPELARASATQPVADDITDDQALDAQELEGQEVESPPNLMDEDPDADPVDPTPTPEPDTTPPTVSGTEPAANATDVAVDSTVQVRFREPVHEVVIEVKGPGGTPVAGETRSNPESDTWTFSPTEPLAADTAHTATASGAVDNAGNALAAPHTWVFTTGTRTSQPTTVALPVRNDTWIGDAGSQGPSGQTLWTGSYDGINERTYLDFDTAPIAGKRIVSATLKLRNTQAYGCGVSTSAIVAQRVTAAWSVATLSWQNKPTSTPDGQVRAQDPGGCSDGANPPVGATWTWDVTGIVQAWASGQASHGLVLQGADESADAPLYDRGFDSAEAGRAGGQAPVLEVAYAGDSGPPPTTPPGQDTTPPTVLATDPKSDAIEVPTNAQVKVTFSEPVRDVQLILNDLLFEEEVPGQTTLSADGTTLTFTPSNELYGYYRAEVTQAKDAAGNSITPYSWYFETVFDSPLKSQDTAARKAAQAKPGVIETWSKPNGERFSRIKTPHLMAKVSDPLGRRSTVRFQVAHDPSVPEQGEGAIWTGEDAGVTSGTQAMVRVPEGKLRDGWKVRWRTQAIAKGAESPWSEWQALIVGQQGGTAAKTRSIAAIPRPVREDPPAAAAGIYGRIDTDECFDHWAKAGKPEGWIKNHFSWCQIGKIKAAQETWQGISGNPPVKEEYYQTYVMLIAYTFTGKGAARKAKVEPRDIVVEAFLFDQKTYGTMPLNHTMVLGMDIGNKPYCDHITTYNGAPHTNYKSLTVSQWKATPTGRATFRFRCAADKYQANRTVRWGPEASDKRSIPNEEKVSFGTLTAYANFPTWPKAINRYVSNTNETGIGTTVRCDSASYVKYQGGCVFHKVQPWVKFHWGKNYDEAFNHYWNACKRPGFETYPTDTSKAIHGCGNPNIPAKENVLHREYPNIRDTNQGQTYRWCSNMWPGYASNNKQCDEYPFASTRERTNVRNDKTTSISLCPVTTADNGAAGRILDTHYYSKDRILVGDVFTVGFETQGMGTQKGRDDLCGIPTRDYWP